MNSSRERELFLTAESFTHLYYESIYAELLPCPRGFELLNGACGCDPLLINGDLRIANYISLNLLPSTVLLTFRCLVQVLHQIVYNTFFPTCPTDYCVPHSLQLNLSNINLQCQFYRSGILCSQCQHRLSMVFGSSRCMKCTKVHIFYHTNCNSCRDCFCSLTLSSQSYSYQWNYINGIIFYANVTSINDSHMTMCLNLSKCLSLSST